ncbi:MAG: beta-lactamase [Gemmatimonadetes bacterium]|jgi:CubicO group peptidase (beta-lactamase class C family)|nr:beta-lactamase [Gemmatimonadota bacterium]
MAFSPLWRSASAILVLVGCAPVSAPVTVPEPVPAERSAVIPPPAPGRLPAGSVLVPAPPSAVGMDAALPARLDSIVRVALAEGAAPGAAIAVGRYGRLVHLQGYGALEYAAGAAPATPTTLYDLASLTKVVATTTAAMILEEQGRLDLSRTVASYVPELSAPDKAGITVRMLLTHSGGFEAYASLYTTLRGSAAYLAAINERPLAYPPGSRTVYSDWDMVLLQAVVERVAGLPLDQVADGRIFRPLGMTDTRFAPDSSDAALRRRIAPTTLDSLQVPLRGTVHDGNARALGGVAGHAGLFSSARDLAVFAQLMLGGGTYGDVRIVSPQAIARWTSRQGVVGSRALGWDTPAPQSSAGRFFSPRSFGHTGFTGTSIWMDPERGLFVVLLMNRVTPRGESTRHVQLRRDVSDAVQSAILDAPRIDWESLR